MRKAKATAVSARRQACPLQQAVPCHPLLCLHPPESPKKSVRSPPAPMLQPECSDSLPCIGIR